MRAPASPFLVAATIAVLLPATAWAHGGSFYKPPPREGRVKEPDSGGGEGGRATTGGSGGDPPAPATTGSTDSRLGPDDWDAWWTTQRPSTSPRRPTRVETPGGTAAAAPSERDHAVSALRAAIDDPDEDVATSALVALGRIGDAASAERFRDVLQDARRTQAVRESAAMGLALLGPRGADDQARESLQRVAVATEVPARLRAICVYAMGLRGEPASVEAIAGIALSPRTDAQVAAAAATSLGLFATPEATTLLLQLLGPGRDGVDPRLLRVHAAHGLALRRDPASVVALRRATQEIDPALRRSAVLALAAVAPRDDAETQKILRAMLDRDDDVSCRDVAVLALGRQGHPSSRKVIEDAVGGGRAVHRTYALTSLGLWAGANREPAAAAAARTFLTPTTDPALRAAACFALSLARDREGGALVLRIAEGRNDTALRSVALSAVPSLAERDEAAPILRRLLDPEEPAEVRREAAAALGSLGDPEAAPLLAKMLGEEERLFVRAAAIVALGRIGGPGSLERLRGILGRPDAEPMLRALSAVGLGLLLEGPARQPLRVVVDDLDWPSMTDAAAELMSIL